MPGFDRAVPWTGTTIAFLAYRQRFTEVNAQYWGGLPSELLARRFFGEHDPTDDLRGALGVTAGKWTHVGNSVQDYAGRFASHRRWSTLLTLMLLTSCFESYLATVGELAVASDPLRSPGFPKRVDEAMLLKHGHELPVGIEGLTRGEWSARVATYRRLFSSTPARLDASVGELDRIRRMRNQIAHQFGLSDDRMVSLHEADPEPLGETRLTRWLGLVNTLVRDIDGHLGAQFIGDYETVRLFHEWRAQPTELVRRAGVVVDPRHRNTWKGFQKVLGGYAGRTAGAQYFRELSSYYSRL